MLNKIASRLYLLAVPPNPREIININFAVTYLCNSKCLICNIWKKSYKNELNFEEIASAFENNLNYLRGLRTITLTGGEPFLRDDFSRICNFFRKEFPKTKICITSNGLDKNLILGGISKIYDRRFLDLYISLDGLAQTYKKIRGVDGYNNVMNTIKKIKKYFPEINLSANFTITPSNYRELPDIMKLAKENKIAFDAQFALKTEYYDNREKEFNFSAPQMKEMQLIIAEMIGEYRNKGLLKNISDVEPYYYSNMLNMLRNDSAPFRNYKCFSGTHSLFLDPFGDIYPCIMRMKKMGNICQEELGKIMFSDASQNLLKSIQKKECFCWASCEANISLMRSFGSILFNLKRIFFA